MAVAEVGTRSVGTVPDGPSQSTLNTSHTVPSGTTLLLNVQIVEGNETMSTIAPSVWDSTNLTLIHDTGSTGSNADVRIVAYGLINPTVDTQFASSKMQFGGDPWVSMWLNYSGTATASVAAATNFVSEDVNTTASSSSVLSSGGSSGNALIYVGGAQGGTGMNPANSTGLFTERLDDVTAVTTTDFAYAMGDLFSSLPSGTTIGWSGTDQNTGILLEIVAASAGSGINILRRRRD